MDTTKVEYKYVEEIADFEGTLASQKWYNPYSGELERSQHPAEIYYDVETKHKIKEVYRTGGKKDAPDLFLPAVIEYAPHNGNKIREEFWSHGKLDGYYYFGQFPAIIEYCPETGEITNEEFYKEGVKIVPSTGLDENDLVSGP